MKKKMRILYREPWHFDRLLMVLMEPTSFGDIKKQVFTHTSFWVHIYSILIMCIENEIVQRIREKTR